MILFLFPAGVALAELLAETGWRINPDERQREFARKSIPLLVIVILAVLFLIARSSLAWLLVGFVVGRVILTNVQFRHQKIRITSEVRLST